MRGSKPLAEMGFMSPQFKALAISQDIIGWREFTEGHILSHFYVIQSFHLAMSSSYLNGEDWTKQFISKILQITHSQWIFRNISFHDNKNGYLQHKAADKLLQHIIFLVGGFSGRASQIKPIPFGKFIFRSSPNIT